MRTHLLAAAVALGLLGTLACERSSAQYRPGGPGGIRVPGRQPAFSPYLNLLRPGASVTQNYLGLVRPQLEFRGAYQQLGQEVATNRGLITSAAGGAGAPTTGHPASFLNTGGYFLSNGGAGPARPTGAGQIGRPQPGRGRAAVGAGARGVR